MNLKAGCIEALPSQRETRPIVEQVFYLCTKWRKMVRDDRKTTDAT